MNGTEHESIVTLAFECLPEDATGLKSFRDEVLSTCMLPDRVAIPLLRGEFSDKWRHYFPPELPKFNFQQEQGDFRLMLPDTRFYAGRILDLLDAGDIPEAARYLGVFSHYLGDFSQPAHHYELHISRLLPPPAHMRNCEYHRTLEDIPNTLKSLDYKPRLLGLTLDEALFRMEGRFASLYDLSVSCVIPMFKAVYSRRFEKASTIINKVVTATAKLFADFCFTMNALAGKHFAPAEVRQLKTCDLREIVPSRYDVEFNFGHRPLIDSLTVLRWGIAQPLALRFPVDGGEPESKKVQGICTIPHALPIPGIEMRSMLEYDLPEKAFSKFECLFGLLAESPRPQAPCTFRVETDGSDAYTSPIITADQCAVPLEVDIAGCRNLRLIVETDGSTDKLAYAIWGKPLLMR